MAGKLGIFIPLLVLLYFSQSEVIGADQCPNFDALSQHCFTEHVKINASKNLDTIIESFGKGIPTFCKTLKDFQECINTATRDCTGPKESEQWMRYQGMKKANDSICVKNRKELEDNVVQCVKDETFKSKITACQAKLGDRATCDTVKTVMKCTDHELDDKCPKLHILLGEVFRSYLLGRHKIQDCDIPHDHASKGSMSAQLSIGTFVTFLTVVMLGLRP